MLKVKALSTRGIAEFRNLTVTKNGDLYPGTIFDDSILLNELESVEIDESLKFSNRFDWGRYLAQALSSVDEKFLYSPKADPVWAWICAVYFEQLTNDFTEIKRWDNYLIQRKGTGHSVEHRNAARTSFILYKEHGECSKMCLDRKMHVRGELTELLTATQIYLRHKEFFQLAYKLYYGPSGVVKGASSKSQYKKSIKKRNKAGAGGARRLIKFLNHLYYTYDTFSLSADQMINKLPREFSKFVN